MNNKTYAKYQEEMIKGDGFGPAYAGSNPDPNISIRSPYGRDIYEYYRPNEIIPKADTQEEQRQVMCLCKSAYERVGVIRSTVDMMSEFVAEGLEILHEDAIPNTFWKAWCKKVKLRDRGERFANWLFKSGNAVIRRKEGTIKLKDLGLSNQEKAKI